VLVATELDGDTVCIPEFGAAFLSAAERSRFLETFDPRRRRDVVR